MYRRIKYGGDGLQYNHSEFLCDTDDDINSLPTNDSESNSRCFFGSIAYVIDSGKKYILGNNNKWYEITNSNAFNDSVPTQI